MFLLIGDNTLHTPEELEEDKGRNDNKKRSSWDFFSYEALKENDTGIYEPVIPGSEIRGAVRNIYEAAFQCCMSAVSGDRTLGRRCPKPKIPGVLEKEGEQWILTPCIKYPFMNRGNLQLEEGQKITGWIKKYNDKQVFAARGIPQDVSGEEVSGEEVSSQDEIEAALDGSDNPPKKEGYYHLGEKFKNRASRSVFVKDKTQTPISVLPEDIDILKKVLEEYRDEKKNNKLRKHEHGGYAHYDLNNSVLPVYYIHYNDHLYLTPACIGKELFNKTIEELLKNNGGFQPCSGTDGVCSGCAVFGMVSGEKGKGNAIGSRVRFTDAVLEEKFRTGEYKKLYRNPILLPELGEPKPGTAEFYTYSPYENKAEADGWKDSEGYWTYDYKCKSVSGKRVELDNDQPRLRGRKYYWHSDEWRNYDSNGSLTSMRQRVRPLDSRSDVHFKFRVYFENLTNEELERVKWALDFHDSKCAHKIGRAKPLGFGSVRITVNALHFRNINPEDGSWNITAQDLSAFEKTSIEENTKAIQTLKIMANWKDRPGKLSKSDDKSKARVCYPLGEDFTHNKGNGDQKNLAASHQWFNGNRNRSSDSINMQPAFSKLLPEAAVETDVSQKEKWLYKLEKNNI